MPNLTNISPLDGRYSEQTKELSPYFSEMALLKYRLMAEVEYFIALGNEEKLKNCPRSPKPHKNNSAPSIKNFLWPMPNGLKNGKNHQS